MSTNRPKSVRISRVIGVYNFSNDLFLSCHNSLWFVFLELGHTI